MTKGIFDLTHRPEIGVAEQITDGLRVITAPNASPMTFTGTRSYILGEGEVAIIDPGPDDPAHFAALMRATRGQKISHVIVTHSHNDHSPLARHIDAPIYAFGNSRAGRSNIMTALAQQGGLAGGEGIDLTFSPDVTLSNGQTIKGKGWTLEAIHTPGHMANHLCFAWQDCLFSGDHVMGWSTTLVSPPDGDLTQFMTSLRMLQNRPETVYYPGHGAPLTNPQEMLEHQLKHRLAREEQILEALSEGITGINAITRRIYAGIDPRLLPMAARNVFSHLIDLNERSIVTCNRPITFEARFFLTG